MRSGCAFGDFERMITVTRTPFSARMRETSKALSPPPITATCEPKSAFGSPIALAPRWRRPAAATRVLGEVEPPLLLLAGEALRGGAEPRVDPKLADVGGELGRVLARALAALAQQPLVRIGAQARHASQRRLLLDDHRVQAVIVQPQRAGHAGRA